MFIIALTGGIGSGKSTVEKFFLSYGVPVIDTDIIARDLLSNDSAVRRETIQYFGKDIIATDGKIDRTKLRTVIFENEEARNALQSILHPVIHQQTLLQLNELKSTSCRYCIIVIPLLAESSYVYPHDRVLLIDSPESLQVERSSSRDQSTPEQIIQIIASQASREQRQLIADDIILNNKDITSLKSQVDILHNQFNAMAKIKSNPH